MAQSPHTPTLPGIREQCGRALLPAAVRAAVSTEFARATGWRVVEADWTPQERTAIGNLARAKYASTAWNEKR